MEGLTDYIFRNTHHRLFPGLDRYYTPFLSPTADGRFDRKAFRDVFPENNAGVPVVPQLLTRHSQDFLWAAKLLAENGYSQVDLNLGCPSGTVVAKGKGAGQLRDPAALDRFLDEIFSQSPLPISIKTRLGVQDDGEFPALLEVFCRYPVAELTVHTRVREDFYRRPARPERFRLALERCPFPLCYNGDILNLADFQRFQAKFPTFCGVNVEETPGQATSAEGPAGGGAVMLGRGLVADPALFLRCKNGTSADKKVLKAYHDTLFENYCSAFGNARNAMSRMKEFWFYHSALFVGGEKLFKQLRKSTNEVIFRTITRQIYDELELREEGAKPAW